MVIIMTKNRFEKMSLNGTKMFKKTKKQSKTETLLRTCKTKIKPKIS